MSLLAHFPLFGFFLPWLSLTVEPFFALSLLLVVGLEGGAIGRIAGGGEADGGSHPLGGEGS
jgi:hypothetical protein